MVLLFHMNALLLFVRIIVFFFISSTLYLRSCGGRWVYLMSGGDEWSSLCQAASAEFDNISYVK